MTINTATITADFNFDITYSGNVKLTSGQQAGGEMPGAPGVKHVAC